MTSGHPRVGCCVPGCHRGTTTIEPLERGFVSMDTGRGAHEYVCGPHWRLVPKAWKRRRRKIHRWVARSWPAGMAWEELTDYQRVQHQSAMAASKRIWQRIKHRAANPLEGAQDLELEEIERRMGVYG